MKASHDLAPCRGIKKKYGMSPTAASTISASSFIFSLFLMSILVHARSMVSIELSAAMRAQHVTIESSAIASDSSSESVSSQGTGSQLKRSMLGLHARIIHATSFSKHSVVVADLPRRRI